MDELEKLKAAGFSDAEIADYQRLKAAGFSPAEIDAHFGGGQKSAQPPTVEQMRAKDPFLQLSQMSLPDRIRLAANGFGFFVPQATGLVDNAKLDASKKAHPQGAAAAEIIGSLLNPLKLASWGARALAGGVAGAAGAGGPETPMEDRAVGAGLGATVGVGLPLLLETGGFANRVVNPKAAADKRLLTVLDEAAMTPTEAAQRYVTMRGQAPEALPADISSRMGDEVRRSSNLAPAIRDRLRATLENRQATVGQRVGDVAAAATGGEPATLPQAAEAAKAHVEQVGKQLYGPFNGQPVVSDEVNAVLDRPEVARLYASLRPRIPSAQVEAAASGQGPVTPEEFRALLNAGRMDEAQRQIAARGSWQQPPAAGAEAQMQDVPSFEQLQLLRDRLYNLGRNAAASNAKVNGTTGISAREYFQHAADLTAAMENSIPGYANANAQYAVEVAVPKAYADGAKAVRPAIRPRDVESKIAELQSLNPQAADAYKKAMAGEIVDQLRNPQRGPAMARLLANPKSHLSQKIAQAFASPDEYQTFVRAAVAEKAGSVTNRAATGNSTTAMQEADAALHGPLHSLLWGHPFRAVGLAAGNLLVKGAPSASAEIVGNTLTDPTAFMQAMQRLQLFRQAGAARGSALRSILPPVAGFGAQMFGGPSQ